jgi:YVTN family beta-propeller protein
VRTEIIAVLVILGLLSFLFLLGTTYGTNNPIVQNDRQIHAENVNQLVPWIGITNMVNDSSHIGVLVNEISPDSPVSNAGVTGGDMIIAADNKPVGDTNDVKQIVTSKQIGQKLNLTLLRDDQKMKTSLIVGSKILPRYDDSFKYAEPRNVTFSVYEDTIHSLYVTMDYPSSWNLTKGNAGESTITFMSLPENSEDRFKEYLRLYVFPSDQYNLDELITVKSPLENLNSTEFQNATIGGIQARQIDYTYFHDSFGEMKVMKKAGSTKDATYLIMYQAQAPKFDTYFPTVEKMLSSFESFRLQDYENIDIGMRVVYPSTWNKTEERYLHPKTFEGVTSVSISPIPQNNSLVPSNKLRISSYATGLSLDSETSGRIDYYKDENFGPYSQFKLLGESSNLSTSAIPYRILNYSYIADKLGNIINSVEVIFKSNHTIYFVSYSAKEEDLHENGPAIRLMIESLKTFEPLQYENFDVGLRFEYPSIWEIKESKINLTEAELYPYLYPDLHTDPSISPICNRQVGTQELRHKVDLYPIFEDPTTTLAICSIPTDLSLSEEINEVIKYHKNQGVVFGGYNETDLRYPAQIFNYSYRDTESNMLRNYTEILTMNDRGRLYSFLFSAPRDEFNQYILSVSKIVNSAELYEVTRYEKVFGNFSTGIILTRPEENPWTNRETRSVTDTVDLLLNDPSLRISVRPSNGSLTDLIHSGIDGANFQIDENNIKESNITIFTTFGNSVEARVMNYTYYQSDNGIFNIPFQFKTMLIYARYNDNDFLINYTGGSYSYEEYLPQISELIKSTRIMDFNPIDDNSRYVSEFGLPISYPSEWKAKDIGSIVYLSEPNDNPAYILLAVTPPNGEPFYDRVLESMYWSIKDIGSLPQFNSSNFTSTKSAQDFKIELAGDAGNTLMYEYEGIDGNFYTITYQSLDIGKYYYYLPSVMEMIKHFSSNMNDTIQRNLTGFEVGQGPSGIAVNPQTDIVYVTKGSSNTVSVLNGSNGDILADIPVGKTPTGIGIDTVFNTVYVANEDSNSLSIIDGSRNVKVDDIYFAPESDPLEVVVNSITHKIYVGDSNSYEIYVIDGVTGRNITTLPTGGLEKDLGIGLAINPFTNRVYAANPATGNITVIDGSTDTAIHNITTGMKGERGIYEIDINPFTNRGYIGTPYSIHSVDLSTNSIIGEEVKFDFPVGINTLAINPTTNKLYATDSTADLVHVLNTLSFGQLDHDMPIRVDSRPIGVAVNPNTNIVYVANSLTNTITLLDGNSNNNGNDNTMMFRTRFDINDRLINYSLPFWNISVNGTKNSEILCNGVKFSDNEYFVYNNQTDIKCQMQLKDRSWSPILFTNWSGLSSGQTYWPNSINAPVEIKIDKPGSLSASFVDLNTLLRTIGPALSTIILVTVIFIASIPTLVRRIRKDRNLLLIDKQGTEGTSVQEKDEGLSKIDIVTINATIMVGVLIFFTISEGFNPSEQTQITWITATIIFPFAISAIVAVTNHERFATHLMVAGFVNLLISTILIIVMKLPE